MASQGKTALREVYKLPKQQLAQHGVNPLRTIAELWLLPIFTEWVDMIAGKPVDLKTLEVELPADFPSLDGPAMDVLAHIVSQWVIRHNRTGEGAMTLEYSSVDAMKEMGWTLDGRSKRRFVRAVTALANIRYHATFKTIPTLFDDHGGAAEVEQEHNVIVALFPKVHVSQTFLRSQDGGRRGKPGRRRKALGGDVHVTISDDFAWFAERGTFKLMHPYLYASRGRWGKQLFALFTSVASKQNDYLLPEGDLRTYFGAPAEVLYWSQLIRRLQPHLDRMKDDGVLKDWRIGSAGETVQLTNENHPRTMRENYLLVFPNRHGYFYSKLDPKTQPERLPEVQIELPLPPPAAPTPAALVEKMLKYDFRPRSRAKRFVKELGVARVSEVLDQLEYAISQLSIRNPGGYLRSLLEENMPAPEGWKPKPERDEEQRRIERTLLHTDHCERAKTAIWKKHYSLAEEELTAAEALYRSRTSQELRETLSQKTSELDRVISTDDRYENITQLGFDSSANSSEAERWVARLSMFERQVLCKKYLATEGFPLEGAAFEGVMRNSDTHLQRVFADPGKYGIAVEDFGHD